MKKFMFMHLKQYQSTRLWQEISATSIIAQLFAIYLITLYGFLGVTSMQWQQADPILNFFPSSTSAIGFVLMLSVGVMFSWRLLTKPTQEVIAVCLKEALKAAIVAVMIVLMLRLIIGAELPAFIPSEESAKPGPVLSMAAGYGEELLFRLILLPLLFFSLIKKMNYHLAAFLSIIIVAIAFAVFHQLGSNTLTIDWALFVTRMLMPGVIFGLLFFYRSPTFIVIMHSMAHVMLPLFFH